MSLQYFTLILISVIVLRQLITPFKALCDRIVLLADTEPLICYHRYL